MVPAWSIETLCFHAGEQGFVWDVEVEPSTWWSALKWSIRLLRNRHVKAVRVTHNTRSGKEIVHTFGDLRA